MAPSLESFGIPADCPLETNIIDVLGLKREEVIQKLATVFPRLLNEQTQMMKNRPASFRYGMEDPSLTDDFGSPWSAGRLEAVLNYCDERTYMFDA